MVNLLNYPQRGDVYLVNFDPTIGAEIKKTRPALVIQNNIANQNSPIIIVAAITSQFEEPLYPTEVLIKASEGGLKQDSVTLLNQIRSIDQQRLNELPTDSATLRPRFLTLHLLRFPKSATILRRFRKRLNISV